MAQETHFAGTWRIVEMEAFDEEYLNEEALAHIDFDDEGRGSFQFGLVRGEMDCRFDEAEDMPLCEFSWQGNDETDEACGRGWAVIEEDDRMSGEIFIHFGDDSSFVAVREKAAGKGQAAQKRS